MSGLGSGGPDDNDAQANRLVAYTLGSNDRNKSQGPANYVAHALTSEGFDASEDGTGRGTPLIPTLMRWREGKEGGGKGELLSEDESLTLAKSNDQVLFDDLAQTVTSSYARTTDAAGSHGAGPVNLLPTPMAVRRLTPVECCRLQGFPDDWFGEPNEQPDGPRYAALGDAVTVNVAEWIGLRLMEVE